MGVLGAVLSVVLEGVRVLAALVLVGVFVVGLVEVVGWFWPGWLRKGGDPMR